MATATRLPRSVPLALGLVVVYILLAAGLGNLLSSLASEDEPAAQFALSHLIPAPIAIAVLLLFLNRAGWGTGVWREKPTPNLHPRRLWLLSIPVLAILVPLSQLPDVPWADRTVGFVALVALGTLMVGFGEELLVRGILLTAFRARRGELVTMLGTALVFALAHIPGSVIAGVPLGAILFQVTVLGASGIAFYWIRRTTGRLWVAMLVHALTDWTLYLASGTGIPTSALTHPSNDTSGSPITITAQFLLWVAVAVSIISVVREDRRSRNSDALAHGARVS